jgi:ribosomal protein L37AE/L43A
MKTEIKKKIPCPECGRTWLRFAKKVNALQCRTCNCQFVLDGETAKVIQHGATYTEAKEIIG